MAARWRIAVLLGTSGVLSAGCGGTEVAGPDPASQFSTALQQAAFEIEVHVDGRAAVVALPRQPAASWPFLGATAADLGIERVVAEPVGRYARGWRRLAVGLRVKNLSGERALLAPRFDVPTPAARLLLIPLESWAPVTDGSVSVDAGTEVVVSLPNRGAVRLAEWSGPPEPFFAAGPACRSVSPACRPYESLQAPVAPGDSTEVRLLRFDLEASVHTFRFRILLAGSS